MHQRGPAILTLETPLVMGTDDTQGTQYRRIYHHHLQKCGGTTFNHWLDTLTFDERRFNAEWIASWTADDLDEMTIVKQEARYSRRARTVFHWSDVVYGHQVLRRYVPAGTFCCTILREPARRIFSQVLAWRRHDPAAVAHETQEVRDFYADTLHLPARALLERHARRFDIGRNVLDNYMTRALAAGRLGCTVLNDSDAGGLLDTALASLEADYDLVGLTEDHDLCRNALCAMIGLPPAATLEALNASRVPEAAVLEMQEASEILEELTRFDRVVYDRACQLFDERHRALAESYDSVAFERHHATRVLAEHRGVHWNGSARYSVRSPIMGSGFHGRDGEGTPSCAVWTGPERRTTLYLPTPPNMEMSLLVWILDYAVARQRRQLRVMVDGRQAVHHFERAEGYADLLVIDAYTSGDFMRIDLEVDETVASGEPESTFYDARKRGILFDSYGWRRL